MKKLLLLVLPVLLALPFAMAPVTVQVSQTNNTVVSIDVVEKTAEAGKYKSKSRKVYKKKKRRKTTVRKKKTTIKPCSTTQTCTSSGSKGKLDTKQLFKKGDKKGKATADKVRKNAPKKAVVKKKTKKVVPVAKVGSKSRPVLSKTKSKKVTASRKKSLSAPQAKKTRLTSNRARAKKTMYSRTRAQSRSMRASRSYWRSDRQYYRNRHWASYNDYGWGYGYRPGWTYHNGWGPYGYGYTRGGLSVVDYMIIYSIFGHNETSNGDTVINNTYIINGEESEVTAVPEGSRLTGFGSKKSLVIPGEDGNEVIEIPTGSTYTQTDEGLLITTPDGVAVLVPKSDTAYSAEEGYEIPEEASAPMEYDELQ